MSVKDSIGKKLNLTGRRNLTIRIKDMGDQDAAITNMMMDPRYLRQSSSLIQDALQKGFDVLQLANGDIVTTGTKTVVYQYTWDEERGKLARIKVEKKIRKEDVTEEPSIDAEDSTSQEHEREEMEEA